MAAQQTGEVRQLDPTVAAWALMGIGGLIGMRWVLWNDDDGGMGGDGSGGSRGREIPEDVFEEMMSFIQRALAPDASGQQPGNQKEFP